MSCQTLCRWGRRCDPPPRSHPGAGQCQSWGRWTTAGTQSWPRPPRRSPPIPPPPRGGHTSPGNRRRLWSILENEQYIISMKIMYFRAFKFDKMSAVTSSLMKDWTTINFKIYFLVKEKTFLRRIFICRRTSSQFLFLTQHGYFNPIMWWFSFLFHFWVSQKCEVTVILLT